MSTMDPSTPGDTGDLTPDELIELDSPAAPWLARKDWASGDLTYRRGSLLGVLVFFFGAAMLMAAYGFATGMARSIPRPTARRLRGSDAAARRARRGAAVVVTVQHELGALFREPAAKFAGVGQAAQIAARRNLPADDE